MADFTGVEENSVTSNQEQNQRRHVDPSVSVVIPAYKCAEYIGQALESVFAQSHTDYEVLVINDGSPDTPLLEKVLVKYLPRIRYFEQATMGPSGARNAGARHARGKYLAFLDADDYWAPEHLARQVLTLDENPSLDLVYCNYMLLKQEKPFARAFDLQPQAPDVTFESLLVEDCAIGMSTVVCTRKGLLGAGGFDEALLRCEDFEMWLRMSLRGARMAYVPEVQVFHRINDEGLSADKLSMKKDRVRVYEKIASGFSLSAAQKNVLQALIARTQAECHVDVLKQALEHGNYAEAFAAAQQASVGRRDWKLKASLLGLRLMPGLFRRLHLVRSRFQRTAKTAKPPGKFEFSEPQQAVKPESDHILVGSSTSKQ
jgi:glycosyltransferase involved in cell wall biosynthesis